MVELRAEQQLDVECEARFVIPDDDVCSDGGRKRLERTLSVDQLAKLRQEPLPQVDEHLAAVIAAGRFHQHRGRLTT